MNINEIKTPKDVLTYMKEHIEYGWIDIEDNKHVGDMKNFRRTYRTSSLEEIIESGLGTCIEQVYLTHYLLDKINIKNKMFCCRIFEPDDYNNLEEEEHMHCFLLYYDNGKVYQMEHANWEKEGIFEYDTEEEAIKSIVQYYIELRGGKDSPTTEFYKVQEHISFKEFNAYINRLN